MTTQTLIGYVKGPTGPAGATGPQGPTGATGPIGNLGVYNVSIATSDWDNKTATKTVSAISATDNVIVTPQPASMQEVINNAVYCSAQAASSLTFVCEETPTTGVDFSVAVIGQETV